MTPFRAWLAMDDDLPARFSTAFTARRYGVYTTKEMARQQGRTMPQPVLIVEDTPDNRRKLGMEE